MVKVKQMDEKARIMIEQTQKNQEWNLWPLLCSGLVSSPGFSCLGCSWARSCSASLSSAFSVWSSLSFWASPWARRKKVNITATGFWYSALQCITTPVIGLKNYSISFDFIIIVFSFLIPVIYILGNEHKIAVFVKIIRHIPSCFLSSAMTLCRLSISSRKAFSWPAASLLDSASSRSRLSSLTFNDSLSRWRVLFNWKVKKTRIILITVNEWVNIKLRCYTSTNDSIRRRSP